MSSLLHGRLAWLSHLCTVTAPVLCECFFCWCSDYFSRFGLARLSLVDWRLCDPTASLSSWLFHAAPALVWLTEFLLSYVVPSPHLLLRYAVHASTGAVSSSGTSGLPSCSPSPLTAGVSVCFASAAEAWHGVLSRVVFAYYDVCCSSGSSFVCSGPVRIL